MDADERRHLARAMLGHATFRGAVNVEIGELAKKSVPLGNEPPSNDPRYSSDQYEELSKIVLYPPQMKELGAALADQLGASAAVCTDQIEPTEASSVVISWEQFPGDSSEKDPNIKVRFDELIGKHVILLMSQDDTSNSFAQPSLLLSEVDARSFDR